MSDFSGNLAVLLGGLFGGAIGFMILAAAFVLLAAPFVLMYRKSQEPKNKHDSLSERRSAL